MCTPARVLCVSGRTLSVQATLELEQGERIAMRLGDEPLQDPLIDSVGEHRAQQRRCGHISQALDDQLREPVYFVGDNARREDERDALGDQPACNERECLCRFAIEPLRVVDDAKQRSFGPELRHRLSTANPTSNRCGATPVMSPNATCSASR